MSVRELLTDCFGPFDFAEPDAVFTRERDGVCAAHVAVYRRELSDGVVVAGVAQVCTAEAFRRHGLATLLVTEAELWARLQRIPFAVLFCGIPAFYERIGYRTVTNLPAPDLVMVKELTADRWPARPLELNGEPW
jgi:predicted N-acetyltransferase YhbS